MKRLKNIIKRKIKKLSMPLVMLFVSATAQASCAKLAKFSGMKQANLKIIVEKLVKLETTTGGYDVKNHRSGAYGRYQIMPSTAAYYAKNSIFLSICGKYPITKIRFLERL